MASSSSGSSSGSSSSDPVLPEWSQQLSEIIAALAANLNGWADQQYAAGQAVTSQTIQNLFDQQGQAAGFANNLLSQYNDIFAPLLNEYAAKAQSWSSSARRFFNMGQAESTAAQADQAGMEGLKRNLEREGVNTSSGAMTEIMRKSAMDDARNRTMAGTQASMQTEQMGNQMMQIAAQMGQNIPGMWATAASVRTSALNAMEQAILGLLNTGVNLKRLPIEAYQAAANAIKLGQRGRSQQQSSQQSRSADPSNSNKDNNQQKQPGQQSSDPRFNNGQNKNKTDDKSDPNNAGKLQPNNSGIQEVPQQPQYAGDWWKDPNLGMPVPGSTDWEQNTSPTIDPVTGDGVNQQLDPLLNPLPNTNGGAIGAFGPNQSAVQTPTDLPGKDFDWSQVPTAGNFGQIPGQGGPGTSMSQPGQGFDPTQQMDQTVDQGNGGFGDTGWGASPTDLTQPFNGDWGQAPDTSGMDQQQWSDPGMMGGEDQWSQDSSWNQPDQSAQDAWDQASGGGQDGGAMDMYGDQPPPDQTDYSGGDNSDYGFARGGVVPTTGGHVPRTASPSRGARTDDIPARLNADEYVIPKDVARHFGTKHFDSLVARSRKMRTGMSGPQPKGERKAPLPNMNRPTFVSKHMGGR